MTPNFQNEVQFVTFADSSKGGPRITLRLADRDELEAFVGMEGKRFMCVLVQIGDQEEPVPPAEKATVFKETHRLGPLALSAVQICDSDEFRQWVYEKSGMTAADYIKERCCIESRRELDANRPAADIFHGIMRNFNGRGK